MCTAASVRDAAACSVVLRSEKSARMRETNMCLMDGSEVVVEVATGLWRLFQSSCVRARSQFAISNPTTFLLSISLLTTARTFAGEH